VWPKALSHKAAKLSLVFQHKPTREANVNGRKWHKVTDLFTTDEINQAIILLLECKNQKYDFNARCSKELVEPALPRINTYTGYNNNPASLAYRLGMYLRSLKVEDGLTRH
jgi:hypothetical protein